MKMLRLLLGSLVFVVLVGCLNPAGSEPTGGSGSGDAAPPSEVVVDDDYNFVEDTDDTVPFDVVDSTPADGAAGVSPSGSIAIFFGDIIDPESLDDVAFSIKAGGASIQGTYTLSRSTNGLNAVIVFSPYGSFPANSEITVTLTATNGLLDDGSNALSGVYEYSFTTGSSLGATDNVDFDDATDPLKGWNVNGNGGTVALPYSGVWSGGNAAALTTGGSAFENVSGTSQGGKTSFLSSGSITVPNGLSRLAFDFVFLSSEFKDFIGTEYDDNVTVSISGPSGSVSKTIDSVNAYVDQNKQDALVSNPDAPGGYRTGIQTELLDITAVGSPLTISFTITDVGDDAFTSMVMIDNIRFE